MLVTLSGITIDARLVHSPNISFVILVRFLGSVTEVSLGLRLKTAPSILVTLSGIVIETRLLQDEKAP